MPRGRWRAAAGRTARATRAATAWCRGRSARPARAARARAAPVRSRTAARRSRAPRTARDWPARPRSTRARRRPVDEARAGHGDVARAARATGGRAGACASPGALARASSRAGYGRARLRGLVAGGFGGRASSGRRDFLAGGLEKRPSGSADGTLPIGMREADYGRHAGAAQWQPRATTARGRIERPDVRRSRCGRPARDQALAPRFCVGEVPVQQLVDHRIDVIGRACSGNRGSTRAPRRRS